MATGKWEKEKRKRIYNNSKDQEVKTTLIAALNEENKKSATNKKSPTPYREKRKETQR